MKVIATCSVCFEAHKKVRWKVHQIENAGLYIDQYWRWATFRYGFCILLLLSYEKWQTFKIGIIRCVISSVINKLRSSGPDHQFQSSTSDFGRQYEENIKDKGERDRGGGTVLQSLRIYNQRLLWTDKHRSQRQSKVLFESNCAHLQYAICNLQFSWLGQESDAGQAE